jgi:hypothetical protein
MADTAFYARLACVILCESWARLLILKSTVVFLSLKAYLTNVS